MKNIMLGKTGLKVSPLCYGTLTLGPMQAGLSVEEGGSLIAYGYERGINFCDTAQLYETYPYIKNALGKISGELIVSSKTYAYTKEMAIEAVEEALKALDRDYIDIFMLHEQESIHTLNGHMPALEVLYDYKARGVIKAVGASMHHVAAVDGAVKLGLDVIHPLINAFGLGIVDGSREDMEVALKKAAAAGIGVFAMKSLGGGNLFKKAEQCFDYIFEVPFVDSVAIGMQSREEIDGNIEYFNTRRFSITAKAGLENKKRHLHIDDWCNGCGSCTKRCGQGAISVKDGMAVCDFSKCVLCGYCSTVCPMWAIKVL